MCKRHAEDGVDVPTNLRHNVFVTHDVDNLDGQNKGNFSQEELHNNALCLTNHLSFDNLGVQRSPIKLDFSYTFTPHLPDSYSAIKPVEGEGVNVIYAFTDTGSHFRSVHYRVQEAKEKDEYLDGSCHNNIAAGHTSAR